MTSAFGVIHKGPYKDPTGLPQMALRTLKTAKGKLTPVRGPKAKAGPKHKKSLQVRF